MFGGLTDIAGALFKKDYKTKAALTKKKKANKEYYRSKRKNRKN